MRFCSCKLPMQTHGCKSHAVGMPMHTVPLALPILQFELVDLVVPRVTRSGEQAVAAGSCVWLSRCYAQAQGQRHLGRLACLRRYQHTCAPPRAPHVVPTPPPHAPQVRWYLDRGLADVVGEEPLTIQLRFEPRGRGHADDQYYLVGGQDPGRDTGCMGSTLLPSLHNGLTGRVRTTSTTWWVAGRCGGHRLYGVCSFALFIQWSNRHRDDQYYLSGWLAAWGRQGL